MKSGTVLIRALAAAKPPRRPPENSKSLSNLILIAAGRPSGRPEEPWRREKKRH